MPGRRALRAERGSARSAPPPRETGLRLRDLRLDLGELGLQLVELVHGTVNCACTDSISERYCESWPGRQRRPGGRCAPGSWTARASRRPPWAPRQGAPRSRRQGPAVAADGERFGPIWSSGTPSVQASAVADVRRGEITPPARRTVATTYRSAPVRLSERLTPSVALQGIPASSIAASPPAASEPKRLPVHHTAAARRLGCCRSPVSAARTANDRVRAPGRSPSARSVTASAYKSAVEPPGHPPRCARTDLPGPSAHRRRRLASRGFGRAPMRSR